MKVTLTTKADVGDYVEGWHMRASGTEARYSGVVIHVEIQCVGDRDTKPFALYYVRPRDGRRTYAFGDKNMRVIHRADEDDR